MRQEIIEKSLMTPEGGVSSSRTIAWKLLGFTQWVIAAFLLVMTGIILIDMYSDKSTSLQLVDRLIEIYTYTIVALFISIFAPKGWTKIGEVVGNIWGKRINGENK